MKKTIIALGFLLAVNAGAIAQTHQDSTKTHKMKSAKVVKYTCTMHPEVVMDKPGKCPKCGMTLVKMKTKKTG
jgi:Heavy metal binding domain